MTRHRARNIGLTIFPDFPHSIPKYRLARIYNINKLPNGQRPKNAIYCGRKNHGDPGLYGNPFPITDTRTREQSIQQFYHDLVKRIRNQEITLLQLAKLHRGNLLCFCAPLHCHCNVLRHAAAWACEKITLLKSVSRETGLDHTVDGFGRPKYRKPKAREIA
jgi:hypothetical protein